MQYLNERKRIFEYVFPDIYLASSVKDFIDDDEAKIKIQSKIKNLSPFSWPFMKTYNETVTNMIFVVFENRPCLSITKEHYVIYDLSSEIEAYSRPGFSFEEDIQKKQIMNGRHHQIRSVYLLNENKLFLQEAIPLGPPAQEFDWKDNLGLEKMII